MKRYIYVLTSLFLLLSLLAPSALVHASPNNLINNPLVETPSTSDSSLPADWNQGNWGTNTTTFSYPTTGSGSDTRSVEVNVSSYTSGDAKWYFNPVNVTAGDTYNYSDDYLSNVSTEVIAQYSTSNGTLSYQDLGAAPADTAFTSFMQDMTIPSGVTSMTVFHLIESTGTLQTDNFSLTAVSTPSVSLSAPAANASVSGTTTVSANASDTDGIASVQFELDGQPLGSPVTSAPYQYSWNTTSATNGSHSLTAIATNIDGVSTTSEAESVTVSNAVAPNSNLINNPLVETPSTSDSSLPADWNQGNWGTNTTTFSYPTTGSGSDTRSVEVNVSSYTSGDAKWYFNPVNVTAGDTYNYSDSYTSTAATDVMAVFTDGSGNTTYQDLGSAAASPSAWTTYAGSFTVPSGTQTVTIYHLISSVGTLQSDNFSLTEDTAPSVQVTAPTAGATVTGTTTITANAADANGVASVQFELDGQPLGSPVTSAPYQYSWNSTTTTNGVHSLTAIIKGDDNTQTTSTPVSINVSNSNPAGGNLIANPLATTPDPSDTTVPEDWSTAGWGTNTTTYGYGAPAQDMTVAVV